ncbi:hypothetical protein WISP_138315 [Willisornis vidua]|uniref:Uncharacterized protein n=1 Tax=Willisornis vidua TaxID=1566151 RepID=A0ABQ9CT05_9PASS|nr:hypothetical protein WISP_138315 [Willisornis vidua]
MGYQLFQQYAVGDSVKGCAKVRTDHIHCLSLMHQAGHLIIKGDQVGQTGPALPKSMLAVSEPLSILKVLCDRTQGHLLHKLARHQGQADRPVVAQVLLAALFVDWGDICQLPIIFPSSNVSEFMQEFTHVTNTLLFVLFSYWDEEFRDMPKNFPVRSTLPKCIPEGMSGYGTASPVTRHTEPPAPVTSSGMRRRGNW